MKLAAGSLTYALSLLRELFPSRPAFRRRHYSKPYSLKNGRTVQGNLCKDFPWKVARQMIRADLRAKAFARITHDFGGEPRRLRRLLALASAHNSYKARTTGLKLAA